MKLERGAQLGPFRLDALRGKGGQAEVWRATKLGAENWQKAFAVKVLAGGDDDLLAREDRFRREAAVCARLDHPNIAMADDFGRTDGHLWFAQEFVDGVSAWEIVAVNGPLPPPHALYVTREVLEALAHAHARGVLHRDVTLTNVMVTTLGGHVKLVDFGLAKFLAESRPLSRVHGVPAFLAPEVGAGQPATTQSDVYSVGCLLRALLTAKGRVIPTTALEDLVATLSAFDPADRFETATAALEALKSSGRIADNREMAKFLDEDAPHSDGIPEPFEDEDSHAPKTASGPRSVAVKKPVATTPPRREEARQTVPAGKAPAGRARPHVAAVAIAAIVGVVAIVALQPARSTTPAPVPTSTTPTTATMAPTSTTDSGPGVSTPPPLLPIDAAAEAAAAPDKATVKMVRRPPKAREASLAPKPGDDVLSPPSGPAPARPDAGTATPVDVDDDHWLKGTTGGADDE